METTGTEKLKWYIVNTQTGCEGTAKASIEERARSLGMTAQFGQILIPSENVVELVKGKKATRSRKFFPGYIFVQMVMTEKTWHLVKNASKVTGFVGGKIKPPEVPEEEVMRVDPANGKWALKKSCQSEVFGWRECDGDRWAV